MADVDQHRVEKVVEDLHEREDTLPYHIDWDTGEVRLWVTNTNGGRRPDKEATI